MNFSAIVRKYMKEQKLKVSDLAKSMGYSYQYISDLLSGNRRWNETTMNKACEVLGIRIVVERDKSA